MLLLYIALVTSNLFWLAVLIQAFDSKRQLEFVDEQAEPASTPKISILVPARNESRSLPQTLDALLKLDYPDYEVIVIDDQSTDQTAEIAVDYARRDPRILVIQSTELPECWKGKPWALQHGAGAAKGSWLLFTDADVRLHPSVLKAALAKAQKEKLDLLSILPHVQCLSFWEKVMLPSFAVILSMIRPLHKSNDPESPVALAAGGFILVKNLIFRHLGGYDSIRDSIIEDVKLAELMKSSGHRIKTALSRDGWVSTRMYESFGQIWEGLSRHAFEGGSHNPGRILGAASAGLTLNVLPLVTMIVGLATFHYTLAALSLLPLVSMMFVQGVVNREWGISRAYNISFPIATLIYCPIMIHSMWAYHFGGGNLWKGRRYGKPEDLAAKSESEV